MARMLCRVVKPNLAGWLDAPATMFVCPGLLGAVSAIIGGLGANIIEVAHNRLALDVPAKGAEFDLLIETRDAQHTQEIMDALREKGYPPRAV